MKLRSTRTSRVIGVGAAAILLSSIALLAVREYGASGATPSPLSATLASLHLNLAPVGAGSALISRDVAINAAKNIPIGRDAAVLDEELGVVQMKTGPLAGCTCWVIALQPADNTYTSVDGQKHQRTYTLVFVDALTGKWLETAGGFSRN